MDRTGPLDEAALAAYREQGFLAIPDFFTPDETRAMQAEVEALLAQGKLRNVATSQEKANLQLVSTWQHSELFRRLPFHPKVVAHVSQIVGDPAMLYMEQIFLKPGGHGAGTNWHQDNDYFQFADPMRGVGLWTAVHAATAENGTMRFIPGSHRAALPHSRDPDSDHHVRAYPDESRQALCELPAGGVVLFNYATAHATGANRTDRMRAGFAMHFAHIPSARKAGEHRGRNGQPVDYTPGIPGRPIISGPEASGGAREYGQSQAAAWTAAQ